MSLARDLSKPCKVLEIEKPLLVGHSMGASVITLAGAIYDLPAEKTVMIEPIYLSEQIYSAGFTLKQHSLASKSIKRRNGWSDRDLISISVRTLLGRVICPMELTFKLTFHPSFSLQIDYTM